MLPKLKVKLPDAPWVFSDGIESVITLTRPPIALAPYNKRGRTAHHFDLAGGRRVGRDRMIARLARQVAHALAVLEHADAIAVEAANHRPRRGVAEFTHRDAGGFGQRRANRRFEILGQLLAVEHGGRLVRLELRPRGRADRQHFGEVQVEIDRDVELDRRRCRP